MFDNDLIKSLISYLNNQWIQLVLKINQNSSDYIQQILQWNQVTETISGGLLDFLKRFKRFSHVTWQKLYVCGLWLPCHACQPVGP